MSTEAGPSTVPSLHIGDVAERTGLSLRTIRHYEEVGLLPRADRSPGGFRLYTEAAVLRLRLVRQMKPLDLTLEQMAEILDLRERLADPRITPASRASLLARLEPYQQLADAKLADLTRRVRHAEGFATELRELTG